MTVVVTGTRALTSRPLGAGVSWFREPSCCGKPPNKSRFVSIRRIRAPEVAEKDQLSGKDAARGIGNRVESRASQQARGFRNRAFGPGHLCSSWFQEPAASWFQEPEGACPPRPSLAWFQELRLTWFSEPDFVVSGTVRRGNRNRERRKKLSFQRVVGLSTALNCLTSLYNRVSFNGREAEELRESAASWGLRPRRLASPLRGYAPGAARPPTRHPPKGVGLRPTSPSQVKRFLGW